MKKDKSGSIALKSNNLSDIIFTKAVYVYILIVSLFCLFPFWLVFINSFAKESSISTNGFMLFPDKFSLDSYKFLLSSPQTYRSYAVSIFVTVFGTFSAVAVTTMTAYAIAHYKVKYRNVLGFLVYLPLVFGGGLVGFYIMFAKWLSLKDSILALIIPYLLNPFFAFILVAFFRSVPIELMESASIDGANDIYTFIRIICPISIPAISTISLFYALTFWNDWWLALLFIDNYKLYPLQMMIRQLMSDINMKSFVGGNVNYTVQIPTYGMQMAIVCVTIGPVILIYPYIQKYFVKGITVGAVKG